MVTRAIQRHTFKASGLTNSFKVVFSRFKRAKYNKLDTNIPNVRLGGRAAVQTKIALLPQKMPKCLIKTVSSWPLQTYSRTRCVLIIML